MKKTLLAVAIAATLITGCATTEPMTHEALTTQGTELMLTSTEEGYSASKIQDLETLRLAVNSVFLVSQPVYEKYTESLENDAAISNFVSATEFADTDEKKQEIYNNLDPKSKKIVDAYLNSSITEELIKGLGAVVPLILKNSTDFLEVDTASALKDVSFMDIMTEKNLIIHTTDQIAYLNSTVISAYQNYQVISAFSNAQ